MNQPLNEALLTILRTVDPKATSEDAGNLLDFAEEIEQAMAALGRTNPAVSRQVAALAFVYWKRSAKGVGK